MVAVNNRKRRKNLETPNEEGAAPAEAPVKRRRRIPFWGVTLALLALVLWLAPTIVAHTPLLNQVVGSLTADLQGTLSVQSASLGWFSPVVLNDVQVRDADNKPLLRAPRLEIGQTLWRLLISGSDLGRLQLQQPEVQLSLSQGGSNVEKLLAKWLDSDEPATLASPALKLEIVDGTLTVDDADSDRQWQIEKLNANLVLARDWKAPAEFTFTGSLPQPDRTATWEAKGQVARAEDSEGGLTSSGQVKLKSEGLPLAIVESFLRRSRPDIRLAGWLASDLTVAWQPAENKEGNRGDQPNQVTLDGQVEATDLSLAGPFVGRDELRLARLKLPCLASVTGRQVTIEQLSLDCDVGQAKLKGPVRVGFDAPTQQSLWSALASQTYELTGELDLARLAAVLPETIRIRQGTEITAGQLSVQLSRSNEGRQSRWQGRLETSNLVATNEGRPITWKKPVLVTFNAHDGPHGPVVDNLVCSSKFLEIEAAGELDSMSASAIYDLNKLAAELGQFIDLGDLDMAGDGWSYITWKRGDDDRFEAEGEFQVRQFRLAAPGRRPWSEENLVALVSLTGQADARRLQRIDTLSLKVDSQADQLVVRLLKPVASFSTEGDWPVEVKVQGQLATWMPRLKPWVGPLEGWDLGGSGELEATGVGSAERIDIERSRCTLTNLHAHGPTLRIDEPQLDVQLAGSWRGGERRVLVDSLKLASSALSVDGRNVSVEWPVGRPPRVVGAVDYAGDMSRLQQWTIDPQQPPIWRLAGALQGQLRMTAAEAADQTVAARLDMQADDLVATRPQSEPWREAQARLSVATRYDRLADAVVIDRVQVTSDLLNCDAGGRIADLSGRRDLTLNGQLDYDPEKLLALLRPYLGEGIEIVAGRESRPFKFQGPLAALSASPSSGNTTADKAVAAIDRLYREFSGEAAFGWTGANVYGFRLASGELRGQLSNGVLNFVPLDLSVSDGRLTAAPRIRLWPEPKELELDRGPLVSQVRISPEMCEAGLKYVAPVLAGVTQAQGQFSIALDGCRVPLDAPDTGELAGQFTVHLVEIGPGPLVRELSVLMTRPSLARLTRESVVPFRMVEGRVYHRDLELVFSEFTVRTHGSVGLDQSLDIMAELPVPPKWIGNNPLGTALKGQTIKLPIGGTLDEPKIDPKALAQVSADFLRGGATNILRDTLNKQLERLFSPPPREE